MKNKYYSRIYRQKWFWRTMLFVCLSLWVICFSGCSLLKDHYRAIRAGRYLNDARVYAGHVQYRQKALQYYQKAWDTYFIEETAPSSLRAEILREIGILYYELQEYENALKYYTQSLDVLKALGEEEEQIILFINTGVIYRYLNMPKEALDSFGLALRILEKWDDDEVVADYPVERLNRLIQLNQAATLAKSGKMEEASKVLGKFSSSGREKTDYEIALSQVIKGIIEGQRNNNSEALKCHKNALDSFDKLKKEYDISFSYYNIGLLYAKNQEYANAIKHYKQSIELCEDIGDRETEWLAHYGLGNIYKLQAELIETNIDFRSVPQSLHSAKAILRSILLQIKAYLNKQAQEEYAKSIDIIESIQSNLRLDDLKTNFLEDKAKVYKAMINLLSETGNDEEAFHYLERAKSRALVDLLSNQPIRVRGKFNTSLLRKKAQIDKEIRSLLHQLDAEYAKPLKERQWVTDLTQQLKQVRERYANVLRKIQDERSEYSSFMVVNPLKLKDIQKLIPEHTAFLEYIILEDKTLIFILTLDGLHVKEVPVTQKELQGRVLAFRIDVARKIPGWQRNSQWLYSKLIPSAEEKHLHDIKTLCIVPYGILHYLPFGALRNESTNEILLEEYDLFYAPSSTVLKFAFDKGEKHLLDHNAQNLFLICANPDGDLKNAEEEAREIERLNPHQTRLLVESDATEKNVRDVIDDYHLLHFATHGILDPVHPLFSALDLAGKDVLEVHEIFNEIELDNCCLVTLSACNTALGLRTEGDEIIGLSRAFMYADTPSIVASLWEVSDKSTKLLMERFWRNLMKNDGDTTMSRVKALKKAQLTLFDDTTYRHPYYWAAFELIGDYR